MSGCRKFLSSSLIHEFQPKLEEVQPIHHLKSSPYTSLCRKLQTLPSPREPPFLCRATLPSNKGQDGSDNRNIHKTRQHCRSFQNLDFWVGKVWGVGVSGQSGKKERTKTGWWVETYFDIPNHKFYQRSRVWLSLWYCTSISQDCSVLFCTN